MQDVDNYATYKSGLTLWLGKPDETSLKRLWWTGGGERDGAGANVCWQGSGCCSDYAKLPSPISLTCSQNSTGIAQFAQCARTACARCAATAPTATTTANCE